MRRIPVFASVLSISRFCLAFCVLASVAAAAEWTQLSPKPTGRILKGSHFSDADHGFAVGQRGTCIQTSDGGAKWETRACPTTRTLNAVAFPSADTGYAVGDTGVILRTVDGGATWASQTSGTTLMLRSLWFLNGTVGFAVGGVIDYQAESQQGVILTTADAGQTWAPVATFEKPLPISSIQFLNADFGVAGEYTTKDGGAHWFDRGYAGTNYQINSIHYKSPDTGWTVGINSSFDQGLIYRTIDSGRTWSRQATNLTLPPLNVVWTAPGGAVYAGGQRGGLYKCANGVTWTALPLGSSLELHSIRFVDKDTGWAMGNAGEIRKTTDGGATWKSQRKGPGTTLQALHFKDANTGMVMGDSGVILSTKDGGGTWTETASGIKTRIASAHFPTPQTGYAVGADGGMIKTVDGGSTWVPLTSGTKSVLRTVFFTSAQTGYAAGVGGIALRTVDGGSVWTPMNMGAAYAKHDISTLRFIDDRIGFAAADSGILLKTTDAGATWSANRAGTIYDMASLDFPTPSIGYATGTRYDFSKGFLEFSIVLKTYDGGASWARLPLDSTIGSAGAIRFVNATTGYFCSDDQAIWKTGDGGNTWNAESSGGAQLGSALAFPDAKTGYAVGAYGMILKISDAEVGVRPLGPDAMAMRSAIPRLEGNTLVHASPKGGTAEITVYDADGKVTWTVRKQSRTGGLLRTGIPAEAWGPGLRLLRVRDAESSRALLLPPR
jgi:photosystem II stability/assembly factor-like uncharacterized protein